jgi:hypothetical protein
MISFDNYFVYSKVACKPSVPTLNSFLNFLSSLRFPFPMTTKNDKLYLKQSRAHVHQPKLSIAHEAISTLQVNQTAIKATGKS